MSQPSQTPQTSKPMSKLAKIGVGFAVIVVLVLIGVGIWYGITNWSEDGSVTETTADDTETQKVLDEVRTGTLTLPPPSQPQPQPAPVAVTVATGPPTCPMGYGSASAIPIGMSTTCRCPSTHLPLKNGEKIYSVFGSNPYAVSSDVCTAAMHAGVIRPGVGGMVTFKTGPPKYAYIPSVDAVGISSSVGWSTDSNTGDKSYTIDGAPVLSEAAYARWMYENGVSKETVSQMSSIDGELKSQQTILTQIKAKYDEIKAGDTTILATQCNDYLSPFKDFGTELATFESGFNKMMADYNALGPYKWGTTPPVTEIEANTFHSTFSKYNLIRTNMLSTRSVLGTLQTKIVELTKVFNNRSGCYPTCATGATCVSTASVCMSTDKKFLNTCSSAGSAFTPVEYKTLTLPTF